MSDKEDVHNVFITIRGGTADERADLAATLIERAKRWARVLGTLTVEAAQDTEWDEVQHGR